MPESQYLLSWLMFQCLEFSSFSPGTTRKGSGIPCKSHIICKEEYKVNLKIFFAHWHLHWQNPQLIMLWTSLHHDVHVEKCEAYLPMGLGDMTWLTSKSLKFFVLFSINIHEFVKIMKSFRKSYYFNIKSRF